MSRSIYKNARIITGLGQLIEDGALVVEHAHKEFEDPGREGKPVKLVPALQDQLAYVGPAEGAPQAAEGDEVIDLGGRTVLPGLIDCAARLDTLNPAANDHVDNIGIAYRTFISLRNAAEALNCGVTTLKAMGMPNNIDLGVRDAINKTMFFGPSILATGPVYGVTDGKGHEIYGMIQESGCDALRTQARIHISRGISGITMQVTGHRLASLGGEYHKEMSTPEMLALTKQAQGAEKPVTATASGDASVKACVEVGVHCVQEGYRISDEVLAAMKEADVSYVPCLVTSAGTDIAAEHLDVVRRAVKAGVQVALGTEMLPSQPMDGTVAVIREMELLVEAGMTPLEAIGAATAAAAQVAHCPGGVLKTGGKPDFIAVDGRPDEDIAAMRSVVMAVRGGRRAFNLMDGGKERLFHIHAPLYEVKGGTDNDWTAGAVQHVAEAPTMNVMWNLVKEI